MSRRAVAWPTWSLCALCVALVALTVLLQHLTPEIPRRDWPPLTYVLVGVLWLAYRRSVPSSSRTNHETS
jgi:hypothetical protein